MNAKIRTHAYDLWPDDHSLRYVNKTCRPKRVRTRGPVRWEGAANVLGAMFHRIGSFFDGGRP